MSQRLFRERPSCKPFTLDMSKRSDADGEASSLDDPDRITVVQSPGGRRGRRRNTISAPNREDLAPAISGPSSTNSETPITVKVHKEYPRFRFIGRYSFKHEDKFISERIYASAPRTESNVPCPSLKLMDILRDVFCGCFF